MSAQTVHTTHSRAGDVGRGVVSLVGVVALVVGVPAALLAWVGSPLPAGVPSVSDVTDALKDTYIPDEFLVKALALVCWLVWIELVASLLVEAAAYVRGRKAGNVPLAGGLQRGAARLIAGVALLGAIAATKGLPAAGGAHATLAPTAEPLVAFSIDDGKAPGDAVDPAAPPAVAPPAVLPTYEVQRRDTLWDIAERHLGDPFRWNEIFRINEGCPQSDGGCLTDPDLIYPGWQLQLPADAVGLAAPPAPPPASPPAPAPAPAAPQDSVAIDGGMVLIDDGGAPGDVLLVTDDRAATGGMVLLPDETAPGRDPATAILAGPAGDELADRPRDGDD